MTKQDRAQAVRDAWHAFTIEDAEIVSEQARRTARSDVERGELAMLIELQRCARARRDRGGRRLGGVAL